MAGPGTDAAWAPFTPVEAGWARRHGLGPAAAREWALEGLRVCDAVRAVALGLSPADVRTWTAVHFAASDAVDAAESGISLEAAVAWRDAGFILPDAALLLRDGWTLAEATAARYAGLPGGARGRPTGAAPGRRDRTSSRR